MSFAAAKAKIRDILEGILIRNLIENPSFETNTAGLASDAGLTLAVDTTQKVVGSQSLKVTSTNGAANKTVAVTTIAGLGIPVTTGAIYTISVWIRPDAANSGALTMRIGMDWLDGSDVTITREYGDGITANATFSVAAADDWLRISYTFVAPTGAEKVLPFIEDNASTWTSGRILYLDGLMFNEGGLEDYVDGTMPGCAWEGTAHASTSKRAVKRVYENPPNTLQDVPCFIIWPGGQENDDRMGGWRVDWHEVRVTLAAGDQEWDRAAAILEAFRPIVVNAFRADPLDGYVTVMTGPRVEPGGLFDYGRKPYLGQDFTIRFRIG